MDIKAKDLIGVGIASLLLFPVVFFVILLASGTAKLEVGGLNDDVKKMIYGYLDKHTPEQEMADMEQTRMFEANRLLIEELEQKQKELREEASRLELLRLETQQDLNKINQNREAIEKKIGENAALSDQKVAELAQVYGAMKPVEAAPILLNLDDESIARIIKKVPEPRTQGKLLAAVGAMNTKRAASVTKILGFKEKI